MESRTTKRTMTLIKGAMVLMLTGLVATAPMAGAHVTGPSNDEPCEDDGSVHLHTNLGSDDWCYAVPGGPEVDELIEINVA